MAQDTPLARPLQEEGPNGYDIMIVRGGGKKPERYWDTVQTIAEAWKKANPQDRRSMQQIGEWIIRTNNIKDADGRDCKGRLDVAVIRAGQRLKLPEGNALGDFSVVYERNCVVPPREKEMLLFTNPVGSPATREIERNATINEELPDYPDGGTGTRGTKSPMLDAWNLPLLLGDMPKLPVPAARGQNRLSTGSQTVEGTAVDAIGRTILGSGIPIPVPGVGGTAIFMPKTLLTLSWNNSSDRAMNSRQGNDGARMRRRGGEAYEYSEVDVAGRSGRLEGAPFTWFNPSNRTAVDAFLVPGVGSVVDANGRSLQDEGSPFAAATAFAYVPGSGSYEPVVTGSRRQQRDGKPNKHLMGTPGAPETQTQTMNFSRAQYVFNRSILPQISEAAADFEQTKNPDSARRVVELMNYQIKLQGESTWPILADLSKPLTEEQQGLLNINEQIAYSRNRFIDTVKTQTGVVISPEAMPADVPVRTAPRAVVRENFINYYAAMAAEQPGPFKLLFEKETGLDKPKYDKKDPAAVRAIATEFVNRLPFVNSVPENSIPLDYLDRDVSSRDPRAPQDFNRNNYNQVELGTYRPKEQSNDVASVGGALSVIADSPETTALLLGASRDGDIAQAFASFDDKSVQLPKIMFPGSRRQMNRRELLAATAERYPGAPELIGTTFSREETKGKVRDLPRVQEELVRTAGDPAVVALRQEDLRRMGTAGKPGNRWIDYGAPGMQMLYALAKEEGNVTLLAIEDRIRKDGQPDAEGRIERLRQGVEYAKDHVTRDMLGYGVDDIAYMRGARSMLSPGVADGQGAVRSTTSTTETQVVVAENINNFYNQLAKYPASAQALVRATITNGAGETPAFGNAGKLFEALAGSSSKEAQLQVAQAIFRDPKSAADLRALVAGSSLDTNAKQAFTAASGGLTVNNAGTVLSAIATAGAGSPVKLASALSAIAGNPQASVAVANVLAGSPDLGSAIATKLTDAQKTDIMTKANVDPAKVEWAKLGTQTVSSPLTTNERIGSIQAPEGDLTSFRDAAKIADGRLRSIATSQEWLRNDRTQDFTLRSLATKEPRLAVEATLQTISDHPEIARSMLKNLDKIGDRRGGEFKHAQRDMTDILKDLLGAQARGDEKDIARATRRLNVYMQGATEVQRTVLGDVVAATLTATTANNVTGKELVADTLITALDNAKTGTNTAVLRNSSMTSDDLVKSVFSTIVNSTDYANISGNLTAGMESWSRSSTRSGGIYPGILIYIPPTGGGKPPGTPDNPNQPCVGGGCGHVTPPPRPGSLPSPQTPQTPTGGGVSFTTPGS